MQYFDFIAFDSRQWVETGSVRKLGVVGYLPPEDAYQRQDDDIPQQEDFGPAHPSVHECLTAEAASVSAKQQKEV